MSMYGSFIQDRRSVLAWAKEVDYPVPRNRKVTAPMLDAYNSAHPDHPIALVADNARTAPRPPREVPEGSRRLLSEEEKAKRKRYLWPGK